jgi:biopolymer transport protein ExbB
MTIWGYPLCELFLKGGTVMWPLLASSVLVMALALDRALAHWRVRLDYRSFMDGLKRAIEDGGYEKAQMRCRESQNPIARVAGAYLAHRSSEGELRAGIVQREGSEALEGMERHIRGLAVLAGLSTLMGLLGTVTGLVTCFQRIASAGGQFQPGDLAAGIWAALVTTVFGLVIAIPATALYHYFDHRTDRVARRMGFVVSYMDEWFGQVTPSTSAARSIDEEE